MGAGASEPGLHFVGDTNATRRADVFVSVLEIMVRKDDAAAHSLDRLGNVTRDSARSGIVDQVLHVGGVILTGSGIFTIPLSPIRIGRQGMMDAETVWNIKLPGVMGGESHPGS